MGSDWSLYNNHAGRPLQIGTLASIIRLTTAVILRRSFVSSLPQNSVDMILPAAGKSRRFSGERKKIFSMLAGQWVWRHAVERLRRRPEVRRIVIAIDESDRSIWETECRDALRQLDVELITGGAERFDSVRAALEVLIDSRWIAVHDAARPLISKRDLDNLFSVAADSPATILACRLRGTVKRQVIDADQIEQTISRDRLFEALTPQIFDAQLLRECYARWRGFPVTDDAQVVERCGRLVRIVEGSAMNIKITVAEDLEIAEALLQSTSHRSATRP